MIAAVAQREACRIPVTATHQRRQAGVDRQVLRSADRGTAGAEQAVTLCRDRDQLERRQGIGQRYGQACAALRIQRDAAFPQQHRLEVLAIERRRGIAAAAAGLHRLAPIVALADDLHLRGRGQHRQRAIAHHRVQHVPAGVGRELQQRLVHRGKGDVGAGGGAAIRAAHLQRDSRGAAGGEALAIRLHGHIQRVPLPADLHLRDAQPIGGLGKVDQRSGFRRRFPLHQPQALPDAAQPAAPAALDPTAHDHDRDIDVRRIAARHRHLDHRIRARQFRDEARQHAFALDGHQGGGGAERHPHLKARDVAGLIGALLRHDVHPVAIVAAEPPRVLARQPHGSHRAGDVAIGIGAGRNDIHLAGHARIDGALRKTLFVGRCRAGRIELRRTHAIVVSVEAADQSPSRGQDLAAVERDRHLLPLQWLAVRVERDEAQAQIVLLHQPAIGLDAQLHGSGVDGHAAAGGQHLAVRVLIIHLDPHVGKAIQRRHVDVGPRRTARAQGHRQRLRRWQRRLLVVAIAIHRPDAFDHLGTAEAVAVIAFGRGGMREPADADVDRQSGRPTARQIADVKVERQRSGPHRRSLWPGDSRAHRRQLVFVDLERLVGVGDVITADDAQVVIAHRRTLRRGPGRLADAVPVDCQRQVELRIRPAMRQAQQTAEPGRNREAAAVRATDDMLHVDRLALADERTVEHRVERLRRRGIAIGQFEVIGADAVAPAGQRETEIVALPGGDHQRMRRGAVLTAAIGFRFGQAGGDHQPTAAIGRAAGQQLARTAVADLDACVGDGLARVERRNPGEAAFPPPFEVHCHVGDQRGGRDIAGCVAAEQRAAQRRAGELDDVEAGLAERYPDDFEIAALAGQADCQAGALLAEDRAVAGVVDPADHRVAAPDFLDILVVGRVDGAQPFGDGGVTVADLERTTTDRQGFALQSRLDVAHGDGQHPALPRFENAEGGGELHQRGRGVEAHVEREAFGVGQGTAAFVLHAGGQRQCRSGVVRQRRLEGHVGDRRLRPIVVVEARRDLLAVRQGQADRGGLAHRDRCGEADVGGLDRAAPRLRVGAAAFEPRGERLAHNIVETLVGTGETAGGGSDRARPDQCHVPARRQRAAAFQRGDAGIERLPFGGLVGDRIRQAGAVEKAADGPALRSHLADQPGGHVGGQHVDRDLLADAVDRAIGVSRDRGAGRRQRRGDQEHLILLDGVAIARWQHCARRGATRIDGKAGAPVQRVTGNALQAFVGVETALGVTGQRRSEVENPGLLIDPAPGTRACGGERRCSAWIAKRHHRLVEAERIALDCARRAADARLGQHHLGAVVAERCHRGERQREHGPPHRSMHPTSPRNGMMLGVRQARSQRHCWLQGSQPSSTATDSERLSGTAGERRTGEEAANEPLRRCRLQHSCP